MKLNRAAFHWLESQISSKATQAAQQTPESVTDSARAWKHRRVARGNRLPPRHLPLPQQAVPTIPPDLQAQTKGAYNDKVCCGHRYWEP